MIDRIKIKHPGPRGWARIAKSAFDPERHTLYGADAAAAVIGPSGDAVGIPEIEEHADAEAQAARFAFTAEQITAMDRDELRQQLDGMGVEFDARWGAQKLRDALAEAISGARD